MKNTGKLTISAVMAALASAFMLTSLFPYLTYAIPAVAGLFIMVTVIETDKKWATATYVVSAAIVLLLPGDNEAKLLYIMFFGYYPILKSLFEGVKNRVLEYLIKFALFNAAVVLSYGLFAGLFGIDLSDMGDFGKYTSIILLAAANIVFPIYDLAVSRLAGFYMIRLHPSVRRILKIK